MKSLPNTALSDAESPIPLRFAPSPEDFEVEELDVDERPGDGSFEPEAGGAEDGASESAGDHLVLRVRAVGLGTHEVARRLARALGVGPRAVSFAGRKDVHAVTTQRLAFEHGDALLLETPAGRAAVGEGLDVLEVGRRRTAFRAGETRGNRFRIVFRDVAEADRPRLAARLGALAARGLPNAFGPQRYGRDGATAELGRLLVAGDALAYLDGLAAHSDERHREAALELARRARSGSSGEKRRATELCRDLDRDLADVARQLARRRDDPDGLLRALSKELRGLHLSALQSRVFDRVLAARVAEGTFDVPQMGDVLLRPGRGPFVLREPAGVGVVAAASLWHLEVSGPMWSPRMVMAEDTTLAAELAALTAEGLTVAALERPGGLAPRGARRALRARVGEVSLSVLPRPAVNGGPTHSTEPAESQGPAALELRCTLPPGAYATTLVAALQGQ